MHPRTRDPTFRHRLEELKARMIDLEEQMANARRRLDRAAGRDRLGQRAVVDPAKCTACGICQEVCPQDAVRLGRVAAIDAERCTGCGMCVKNCPRGAIRLSKRR